MKFDAHFYVILRITWENVGDSILGYNQVKKYLFMTKYMQN